MKKNALILILVASFVSSAEVSFFVQLPLDRNWLTGIPVLIENDDGVIHQMSDVGGNGWFRYSWDNEKIPESVFIYSASDALFRHPLGLGYSDGGSELKPIPMKKIFGASSNDSIFFQPDEQCWLEDGEFSIEKKILDESQCNGFYVDYGGPVSFFMLIPDYKEWVDEIPIIVDSAHKDRFWEMEPDPDGNLGWFYYQWKDDEWVPEHILIYMKRDTLLEHPIGTGGYAYGETELMSIPCCGNNDYFVPDWRYKCGDDIVGPYSRFISENRRTSCVLRYDSRKELFEPFYYPYTLYYSVYGKDDVPVIPEHYSADSTEMVYFKNHEVLMNSSTDLDDGTYILKFWFYDYERRVNAQRTIRVENGLVANFASLNKRTTQMAVWETKRKLRIADGLEGASYAVFNPVGQVIAHGRIQGPVEVSLPTPGVYLVKVGSEVRRVDVR